MELANILQSFNLTELALTPMLEAVTILVLIGAGVCGLRWLKNLYDNCQHKRASP